MDITAKMENKLAASQGNMEGSMLGITIRDRKTNEWIKVQDILKNNKARKTDVDGSCGKKKRRKMDYSCDRVDTTHWEKKSGQTVQEL